MAISIGSTGMNKDELMRHLSQLSKGDYGAGMIEAATRFLQSPHDIQNFYKGYTELLRNMGIAQAVANQQIGYVIRRADRKIAEKWFYVLPDILPLTSDALYRMGAERISESSAKLLRSAN